MKLSELNPVASFSSEILSNDVELNPGPNHIECLTFTQWNINSLGKDNSSRIKLLQAQMQFLIMI